MFKLCAIVLIIYLRIVNGNLPPYIKPCYISSPSFKECAIKNGNEAVPYIIRGDKRYNIPPMNPLVLPFLNVTNTEGLNFFLTTVVIKGFESAKILDYGLDMEKKLAVLEFSMGDLALEFDYVLVGKIASLPVHGNGKGKIDIYEPDVIFKYNYTLYKKDNRFFNKFDQHEVIFTPKKVTFNLDNLFDGNTELANHLNNFMNENWELTFDELKPAVNELVISMVDRICSDIMEKAPIDEIFLGYRV